MGLRGTVATAATHHPLPGQNLPQGPHEAHGKIQGRGLQVGTGRGNQANGQALNAWGAPPGSRKEEREERQGSRGGAPCGRRSGVCL